MAPNENDAQPVETTEEDTKLNKSDFLKLISNALKAGTIESSQAKSLRQELGIFNSEFTQKKLSSKERKKKRKAQKTARKATTKQGFKGQKINKGQSHGRGR